jgi:hypothetical protein
MLSKYNAIDIEFALRTASPPPPFPPAANRDAWDEAGAAVGGDGVAAILARAEADAQSPIPSLPATLYLEFQRTGQREGYENPVRRRRQMLWNLTLAECLENEGRFLDPALDVAWAICEESSWAYPAHQYALTDMEHPIVDLFASMTALELAEFDLLLGSELDPALGKRIRYEVDRRCTTPYLTRHDHWWLYNSHSRRVNNWTAVCNGGTVGAAIYLEQDVARLAELISRAARSLDDYLDTFDPDGGSSEGPGYWSFGFGYYTLLAHLVEQRTEGQISFLEGERIREIAQYPLRTLLSPGWFVNFSDCDRDVALMAGHLAYLSRRLDIPALMQLARANDGRHSRERELTWGLRNLFWRPSPEPAGRFVPARQDWFSGMMWLFARYEPENPDALVLAAKGGHNGEMHNQNDVGTIIVHLNGESVIADVGRGRYTRFYFGPERYEHFVNSSRGHSVPVPNGHEQLPGIGHGAILLEHHSDGTTDRMAIEMKGAYPPEADLAMLRRTVGLHRAAPQGWVELVDEVRFGTRPGSFESVLTTFGQVEVGSEAALLSGERGALRVLFDPDVVAARVDVVEDVDLAEGPAEVRRAVFALREPTQSATIHLRIEPV